MLTNRNGTTNHVSYLSWPSAIRIWIWLEVGTHSAILVTANYEILNMSCHTFENNQRTTTGWISTRNETHFYCVSFNTSQGQIPILQFRYIAHDMTDRDQGPRIVAGVIQMPLRKTTQRMIKTTDIHTGKVTGEYQLRREWINIIGDRHIQYRTPTHCWVTYKMQITGAVCT